MYKYMCITTYDIIVFQVEAEDQIKSIGQFVQSAVMIYLAKSSGKASPSKSQPQEEKLLVSPCNLFCVWTVTQTC